jgi:hypothetical protein
MINVNTTKTPELKTMAMKFATSATVAHREYYTKIVKALASRLKANPKKVRRQARTQFWAT